MSDEQKSRPFHIGDVLSITDGHLVSPRHIAGVYDILTFMTGDNLFTHQLPRAMDECRPHLLRLYPELRGVDGSSVNESNWHAWLDDRVQEFGETLTITPLPRGVHAFKDPIDEAVEMVGAERVITVNVEHP
jgi:hypothetical protein